MFLKINNKYNDYCIYCISCIENVFLAGLHIVCRDQNVHYITLGESSSINFRLI